MHREINGQKSYRLAITRITEGIGTTVSINKDNDKVFTINGNEMEQDQ